MATASWSIIVEDAVFISETSWITLASAPSKSLTCSLMGH